MQCLKLYLIVISSIHCCLPFSSLPEGLLFFFLTDQPHSLRSFKQNQKHHLQWERLESGGATLGMCGLSDCHCKLFHCCSVKFAWCQAVPLSKEVYKIDHLGYQACNLPLKVLTYTVAVVEQPKQPCDSTHRRPQSSSCDQPKCPLSAAPVP